MTCLFLNAPKMQLLLIISSLFAFLGCAEVLEGRGDVVKRNVDLLESYDFVVVGGGTSGLTVADRLTEDPSGMLCALQCLQ